MQGIESALAVSGRPPHRLDLDGAQRTAEILHALLRPAIRRCQ
jgi:hypothetical protein